MSEKGWITRYFVPLAASKGAAGLRDDVALLDTDGVIVVTADALVENVHFLPTDPIETVAQKLVRVNVSDILAKGARPLEAMLTLGWPTARKGSELQRFAASLGEELKLWNAALIGGDTTTVPQGLILSLTLTGRCIGKGPVRRAGAKAGDDVWVTGEIGAAMLGLEAIRRRDMDSPFVSSYRVPALPAPSIADVIAAHAHASLDVSDGLLGDAKALATASRVALHLALEAMPIAGDPQSREEKLARITWGDDYQCLFTVPPERAAAIEAMATSENLRLTRIGHVESGRGLFLSENGTSVNLPETLGFEHG